MKKTYNNRKNQLLAACFIGAAVFVMSCSQGKQDTNSGSSNTADKTILGAGSTFVNPLFSKMFAVYDSTFGIQVNYQSIGSGGGILQLNNKTVDFGDSDGPLTADQTQKMGAPVLHIPMCAGAVVISYNLPGVTDTLNITPDVVAGIYLGNIKKWNDPKITAINKGVKLPDLPILVAHRADGSGTTAIFTDYLSKVSPDWKTKVGEGTAVNWPVGLGGKGNEGVSGLIKQTPGGIGYIELAYAVQNQMPYAKVQNMKGNYIVPTIASTSAAANVPLPADSKIFIANTSAPDGYPIAGFTWALIYTEQGYNGRSFDRAQNVLKLLWWNIHQGQQYCAGLNYAPLAPAAVSVAEKILKSATFDGKQILN